MNLSSSERDEPEINLTSLIDVVLLLLVFFMITTSFVKESQIAIRLPESSSSEGPQFKDVALEISVTAQGTYLVNGRALLDNRPKTLEAAIRKIGDFKAGQKVTISGDAQASHQAVVTAMDIVGRLGYVEIRIATVNSDDGTD
ncbi:MAG: biopolymer transporter ExbD [Gammaproteobacteria bacterium]|nr:biopolymer transporter ExbD [Gammaproteobacteria bacterium]